MPNKSLNLRKFKTIFLNPLIIIIITVLSKKRYSLNRDYLSSNQAYASFFTFVII